VSSSTSSFSLRQIAIAAFGPSLLFGLAEGAIFPVIALSARQLGASLTLSGIIVALIGVGSLLSNIPASMIASRYGERRSMMGAAALSLLALLLCLFAQSAWVLAAGVFMIGMAQSVFMLARQTYLTEAVPIAMRARALSTLGGVMRIGLFAGPFIGAGLMALIGLSGAYWVAIAATLAAGVLSTFIPDLQHRHPSGGAHPVPRIGEITRRHAHTFMTLGVGCMLVSALRACRQIVIPLWASHIGLEPTTTAIVYGAMGAIDMLLFYPSGHVMDKRGRHWVAIPSMVVMGVCLIAMPLTQDLFWFTVVSMILGLGNGIGSGIIMTIGADASPPGGRTQFLGVWRFINDLGACGGPLLVSGIAAASLGAGIATIGVLGLGAAATFWKWLPRKTPGT